MNAPSLPEPAADVSAEQRNSLHMLMIGARPPPPTGQSIAFEVLLDAFARYGKAEVIDLAERYGRRDRAFSSRRAISVLGLGLQLARWLTQVQAVYMQIAQSRWGLLRDCLYILIAKAARRPVVTHLHGGGYGDFYRSEPRLIRRIIRHALTHVDRMIVLSDALRENFSFMGKDFEARLRSVANPCPIPTGHSRSAPRGALKLLYLSNLVVEKGYLDCVDAMVHVRRLLPDVSVKLTLAGAPVLSADHYTDIADLVASLRKHIRYLGLEENVEVAGVVIGDEKLRLLDEAHIMLLPTFYRNEGQPIALIEALASGVPFVATAWRGIRDLQDEDVGLIVPAKSPVSIAEAVALLVRSPERYQRMSQNAIALSARYGQERHIDQMIGIFREVCETHGRSG